MSRKSKKKEIKVAVQKEVQRRAAQAEKTRKMSPQELVHGFGMDVTSLIQSKEGLKLHVQMRIDQARALKEQYPLQYNDLRLTELENIKEMFKPIDDKFITLAAVVGKIEDEHTDFMTRFTTVTDNLTLLVQTQYAFDAIARKLQEIDAHMNQSLDKLANSETTPEQTVSDSTVSDENQNTDTPLENIPDNNGLKDLNDTGNMTTLESTTDTPKAEESVDTVPVEESPKVLEQPLTETLVNQ